MAHQKKRLDSVTSRKNRMEELRGLMPVRETAARMGVDFPQWYKWERGDTFPTIPYLWKIEDLLSSIQGRPITYRDIWPGADPSLAGL